ncbi:glycosyltransferase family 2 protein [Lysinibacillus sp. NPDC097231]|uniref:glycosyltransferase family 2 protein n=1 Tax=Lysinibacillus sp. NPDC097231 TaxID=3364142 RepID=UPI0037FB3114
MEIFPSVIIPTYNQSLRLNFTLESLLEQTESNFEVIIVDDGSTDNTKETVELYKDKLMIKYRYQNNRGRAEARNEGINISRGNVLLFLDADRPVSKNWVKTHIFQHQTRNNLVCIGEIREFYFSDLIKQKESLLEDIHNNYIKYQKFSRKYSYWNFVSKGFDNEGNCFLNAPWITTLIGNLSMRKELLEEVGKFDINFKSWGFEHFELGYRLFNVGGARFKYIKDATNYHLAHSRPEDFYKKNIDESRNYFFKKYNDEAINSLSQLLNGEISLNRFNLITGDGTHVSNFEEGEIFYKSPSLSRL